MLFLRVDPATSQSVESNNSSRPHIIYIVGDDIPRSRGNLWRCFINPDPQELHNVINDKKYQETIKKLKVELLKQKARAGDSDEKYPVMKEIFVKYWK